LNLNLALLKRRFGKLAATVVGRTGKSGDAEPSSRYCAQGEDRPNVDDKCIQWLEQNRQERMDATLPIFEASRREFHLERYRFATKQVGGQRVLDCAAGTGYGARLLLEQGQAREVIGIEVDQKAVEYAITRHGIAGVVFICASGDCLPIEAGCVDTVTSFETIEHVPDEVALVAEFHRVLRPGGRLIISTPNQWPVAVSPFHLREYDRLSFLAVLNGQFECIELYNQNSGSASPFNREQPAGIVPTTYENERLAECYLAVCRRKSR